MTPRTAGDALKNFITVLAAPPVYSSAAQRYLRQELMTIEEAATELKCSEAAVMQRIADGEILAVAIGIDRLVVARQRVYRLRDLKMAMRPSHLPERR
jgi:hypothetical protein